RRWLNPSTPCLKKHGHGPACTPNPANDKMTLRIFADTESEVPVYLADALGRKFFMGNATLAPGENNITYPLSGFSAGVYYITAGTGRAQVTKMLLIKP
ncbi:MAG: T9SS type A sorting domain-containing protein, partial [Bacteroidales bacterium]